MPGSGVAAKAGSRLKVVTHIHLMPMTLNARLEGNYHVRTLWTYGKSISPCRNIPCHGICNEKEDLADKLKFQGSRIRNNDTRDGKTKRQFECTKYWN